MKKSVLFFVWEKKELVNNFAFNNGNQNGRLVSLLS